MPKFARQLAFPVHAAGDDELQVLSLQVRSPPQDLAHLRQVFQIGVVQNAVVLVVLAEDVQYFPLLTLGKLGFLVCHGVVFRQFQHILEPSEDLADHFNLPSKNGA